MSSPREGFTVATVESELDLCDRFFVNCFNNGHAKNGLPDILTLDASGRFVGIECKRRGEQPVFTQYEQGRRILKSGGRFIVGYPDFTTNGMDAGTFPVESLPDDLDELVVFSLPDCHHTTELVLS